MRRKMFVASAGALGMAGLVALSGFYYTRPTTLRIAVSRDTDDHRLIIAFGQVLAAQRESVRLKITPVNEAAAASAALEAGEADLAVVRTDIALPPSGQTLAILHRNPAILLARADAGIQRVNDLRGRTVGVVKAATSVGGNVRLMESILAQYSLSRSDVKIVELLRQDVAAAVAARSVDAVLTVGTIPTGPVTDTLAAMSPPEGAPPVFIPITEAKAIALRSPAYESTEVVHGAFGGDSPRPAVTFETIGVTIRLVAKNTMRDSIAGDVTRVLFTERSTFAQTAPLANQIETPSTEKGAALQVHPGAAAYLDGESQTFFERYSDAFYIGAMLISIVGSAIAALASRLSNNSHVALELLLQKLLGVLKNARAATNLAELDELEREADEILVEGIAQRGPRGMEPQGIGVLSLALDQARLAIRERRRALDGARQPPRQPPLEPFRIAARE